MQSPLALCSFRSALLLVLASIATGPGCRGKSDRPARDRARVAIPPPPSRAVPAAAGDTVVTAEFGDVDSADTRALTAEDTARALRSITPAAVSARPARLPFRPQDIGPGALHVQILLDRANFSPGLLTGTWNANSRRSLEWFQRAQGLAPTGVVDSATYAALTRAAGADARALFTRYEITDADLAGPFVEIPDNVYDKAELDCLCYSSPREALGERFHVTPRMLARLNPGVKLDALRPGVVLDVPNVARDTLAPAPYVADSLVVSRSGFWTNVFDPAGRLVAHYPSTLGSSYNPSPTGDFWTTTVARYPQFHYQPKLFSEVPDSRPEAMLPSGPNSPVGVVWIALSKEHLGIHGTSDPTTIGTATSHGCVRLTNWDAWTLASAVGSQVPVRFR